VRSPLRGVSIKIDSVKMVSASKGQSGFDTFRKGSPDFRHGNMLQEESKHDVYDSPLFMKKSLMASLKKSLQSINLLQNSQARNGGNETRHSSPDKLSPSKFSGNLIRKENKASEDRSFRLKQLEMHERQDSE